MLCYFMSSMGIEGMWVVLTSLMAWRISLLYHLVYPVLLVLAKAFGGLIFAFNNVEVSGHILAFSRQFFLRGVILLILLFLEISEMDIYDYSDAAMYRGTLSRSSNNFLKSYWFFHGLPMAK